jgi:hypothetical protein
MRSHIARDAVQAFYDLHPYPPPVDDLEGYRQRWQGERQAQPATAGCACGARTLLCPRV